MAALRAAIRAGRALRLDILNFRKDGTPFWNDLSITPVRGEGGGGAIAYYVGIQSDVSARYGAFGTLAAKPARCIAGRSMMSSPI